MNSMGVATKLTLAMITKCYQVINSKIIGKLNSSNLFYSVLRTQLKRTMLNTKIDYFVLSNMVLAQDEIDACREAFLAFDKDRYSIEYRVEHTSIVKLQSHSVAMQKWHDRRVGASSSLRRLGNISRNTNLLQGFIY